MNLEAFFRWVLFALATIGQTTENVTLPLAVNQDVAMCVVLLYTGFTYMCFFTLLDSLLEPIAQILKIPIGRRHMKVHDAHLVLASLGVSLSGVGAVFGGAPDRTPLTLQMAMFMISNLCAARFKIWALRIKGIPWFGSLNPKKWGRFQKNYWIAFVLYMGAFSCVMIDRLFVANVNGSLSPYCLFFALCTFMNMFLNVQEEKAMQGCEENQVGASLFEYFKQYVSMLRRLTTWIFIFNWISIIVSLLGADKQKISRESFEKTWSLFLPLGNLYMDLFNTGYIIVFLSTAFLNKIDASLTATSSNVATVISVLAGFLPTIGKEAVGYSPNPYLTVAAVIFAAIGIYPSEQYSKVLREATEHAHSSAYATIASGDDIDGTGVEKEGLQSV